jgi:tetratricopeptide (TPR) repeat protein
MKTFGDIVRRSEKLKVKSEKFEGKRHFFSNLKKIMSREMGETEEVVNRESLTVNREEGTADRESSIVNRGDRGNTMLNVKCQLSKARPEAEQSTLQGVLKCIYSTSGRHWLLVALVFLLPLWFLPWGEDKLGLAKQLLMTIFVGVGLLLWIYESISNGKIVYRKSRINTGILVLLLAFLLSTIFSLHPATSIYGSSANFGNLWNFIILFGVYFLVVNNTREIGEKETVNRESLIVNRYSIKLLYVFLVSTGLVVFYALLKILGINILGGFTKSIGFNTIGTMNSVAILAGLGLIVCMGKTRDKRDMGDKKEDMNRYKMDTNGYELIQNRYKWILWTIGIVSFVFIVLTNFAPVWYGLILSMITMIVSQARKGGQIQMKTFSLPIAVLAVSIVFVLWGALGVRIGLEQPQVNLKNLPTEVYLSHKTSLDIAGKTLNQSKDLEQSFFGVGLGNFNKSWLLHKPADLNQTDFWQTSFIQGFSSFTTLITETGYFGILAIVILIGMALMHGLTWMKRARISTDINRQQSNVKCQMLNVNAIALVFLTVIWFFYAFNISLYFALFLFMALLAKGGTALRQSSGQGDINGYKMDMNGYLREIDFGRSTQKALIFSLSLVFFAIVIVFAMYFEIRHYVSSANTATGAKQQAIDINGLSQEDAIKKIRGELDAKINLLVNAYNLDKNNDVALRNISQYYISKINLTIQENKNLDISPLVQSAILAAKKATEINSTEYLNYLNLAQVYETFIALSGDAYSLAIDSYNRALELSPNDPSILLGIARSQFSEAIKTANSLNTIQDTKQKDEMIKKQDALLTDAIQNLNKAIVLKVNYTPAHQLLAQIYDAQGKIDEAIVSTTNLVILNQQDAGMWFQLGLLYYKKSDMDKAETAFGQAVVLKDDYSNARYFLGLVYAKKNKKTEAIDQFEKVAKLNPDNQEVKTILENLKMGKDALASIVPPNTAPEKRTEAPIK